MTFEGRVEPVQWGRSIYTVLPLPTAIATALDRTGAKRVEGEIADHPVNLAPARAPVIDGPFLWTGKTLLDAAGIAPGDPVEVRLRPADPDHVDLPADVATALAAAGRSADWAALSPGKRRGLLHRVETAKRAETRAKRIAALVAGLTGKTA